MQQLGGSISAATDKVIEFYRTLDHTTASEYGIDGTWEEQQNQIDNYIAGLENAKRASQEWGKVLGVSGQQIAQAFSSALVSSVTNFIDKLAAGKNVFKSLADGIREFAAQFIQSIAQMILQILAYAEAVSILRVLGVAIPGASVGGPTAEAGSGLSAIYHAGGIAGSAGGVQRRVPSVAFANAMRLHTGGIAGIGPDEVATVLQRGEEVLTTGDPRHRANGGGTVAPAGDIHLKNVTVFSPADVLAQALATKADEKVLINHVSRNSRAFSAAIS